jgi:hypothetical protein
MPGHALAHARSGRLDSLAPPKFPARTAPDLHSLQPDQPQYDPGTRTRIRTARAGRPRTGRRPPCSAQWDPWAGAGAGSRAVYTCRVHRQHSAGSRAVFTSSTAREAVPCSSAARRGKPCCVHRQHGAGSRAVFTSSTAREAVPCSSAARRGKPCRVHQQHSEGSRAVFTSSTAREAVPCSPAAQRGKPCRVHQQHGAGSRAVFISSTAFADARSRHPTACSLAGAVRRAKAPRRLSADARPHRRIFEDPLITAWSPCRLLPPPHPPPFAPYSRPLPKLCGAQLLLEGLDPR